MAQVYLAGAFASKEDITALLRASGARLLTRPPAQQLPGGMSDDEPASKSIALWDQDKPSCAGAGVRNLALDWFLDSVSRFEVQPISDYQL